MTSGNGEMTAKKTALMYVLLIVQYILTIKFEELIQLSRYRGR